MISPISAVLSDHFVSFYRKYYELFSFSPFDNHSQIKYIIYYFICQLEFFERMGFHMKGWHRTAMLPGNTYPLSGANNQHWLSFCRCPVRTGRILLRKFLSDLIDVLGTLSLENGRKCSVGNIYPDFRSLWTDTRYPPAHLRTFWPCHCYSVLPPESPAGHHNRQCRYMCSRNWRFLLKVSLRKSSLLLFHISYSLFFPQPYLPLIYSGRYLAPFTITLYHVFSLYLFITT